MNSQFLDIDGLNKYLLMIRTWIIPWISLKKSYEVRIPGKIPLKARTQVCLYQNPLYSTPAVSVFIASWSQECKSRRDWGRGLFGRLQLSADAQTPRRRPKSRAQEVQHANFSFIHFLSKSMFSRRHDIYRRRKAVMFSFQYSCVYII